MQNNSDNPIVAGYLRKILEYQNKIDLLNDLVAEEQGQDTTSIVVLLGLAFLNCHNHHFVFS